MKPILAAIVVWIALLQICSAEYAVQVGAYTDRANALEVMERLKAEGYPVVEDVFVNLRGTKFVQIMAGPYATRKEAQDVFAKLKQSGWTGFVRRVDAAVAKPSQVPTTKPVAPVPPSVVPPETKKIPEPDLPPPVEPETEAAPEKPAIPDEPPAETPELEMPSDEPEPINLEDLAGDTKRSPFSGFLQNDSAYTYAEPEHGSKFKNRVHLGVEGAWGEHVKYKISGRFYYDAIFDINDFYSEEVEDDQKLEAIFHETYLDVSAGDWDFRLGRQHIIWGEVIGLFFADVVSAKDLREFVLLDFDLIRIPQWAARAEYFKDDFHAEFIVIPYMTYDEIGVPGSDFYPFPPLPPPEFGFVILDERQPDNSLENAAYGGRLSILKGGWDVSAFYYGSLDASPFFFRQIDPQPVPVFIFQPDHDRIHQFAVTASKDFGSFIFKGEAIYTVDRWFSVEQLDDVDGIVQQDFLDYVVGFERPLPNDSRINVQFFQRWFPSHDPNIFQEDVESGFSAYASAKILNEKLEPEGLFIYSITREDYMIRLKLNWYFHENWRFTGGADILNGTSLGLFGRFDQNDRVYSEVRFSF